MIRSAVSKVMWVGRATVFIIGLCVIVALVLGVATMAFAGNGNPWILGQSNSATAITKLAGSGGVDGPMLQVTNNNAGSDDTALDLNVQSGEPPIDVNSTTKVSQLNADRLDGLSSGAFAAAYERIVVVSPVGTNTQNGQALLAALASIKDASASKPYLLYIEPATYDLGNGSLTMKPWVDIEGSGELNTVITSAVSSDVPTTGTVIGANNTEMRFFTAQNTAHGSDNIAILNDGVTQRLTHVTAESIGAGGSSNIALMNEGQAITTMTDVTATASGTGLNVAVYAASTTTMIDVTATASGGDNNNVGTLAEGILTVRQSKLSGGSGGLSLDFDGSSTRVALSQLVGGIQTSGGTILRCFNNYDENMAPVTCPS